MPVGQAVTATSDGFAAGRRLQRQRRLRPRVRPARSGGSRSGAPAAVPGAGSPSSWLIDLDDLLDRARRAERVGEGGLDQRAGQLGQDGEVVGVAAGGSGDEERQVGGAVLGAEVDRRVEPGEGERRGLDARGAAVRDGDAAGQAGRGGGLAGERVLDELVPVGRAPGVVDDGRERTDDVVLVLAPGGAEAHQVRGDEVGHEVSPSAVTPTSSVRSCEGWGMVVPGRPAAALP